MNIYLSGRIFVDNILRYQYTCSAVQYYKSFGGYSVRRVLVSIVIGVVFVVAASASTSYSFSTSATYSGGTGAVSSSFCPSVGDLCIAWAAGTSPGLPSDPLVLQLVYTPNTTNNGNAISSGTGDNFGSLQAFCIDNVTGVASTSCGNVTLDGHLDIALNETVPTVATGHFVDALGGTFTGVGAGFGLANFATTSFSIGVLGYQMQQPGGGYSINAVANNAPTSLQGIVTDNTVSGTPEPATFALMGAGLLGLGVTARRKRS